MSIRTRLFFGTQPAFSSCVISGIDWLGTAVSLSFGFDPGILSTLNESSEKWSTQMTLFLSAFSRPQAALHCSNRCTFPGNAKKDSLVVSVYSWEQPGTAHGFGRIAKQNVNKIAEENLTSKRHDKHNRQLSEKVTFPKFSLSISPLYPPW